MIQEDETLLERIGKFVVRRSRLMSIFLLITSAVLILMPHWPQIIDQFTYWNNSFNLYHSDRIDRALLNNPDVAFIYEPGSRYDPLSMLANCDGPRKDIVIIFFEDRTFIARQNNGEIAILIVDEVEKGGFEFVLPNGQALDVGSNVINSCDGLLVIQKN